MIIFSYSLPCIYLYLFVLCIEIFNITKNPLDTNYKKREKVYHIVIQSVAIILTIIAVGIGDTHAVDSAYCV